MTASAGVAPNKFLAKLASDRRKPDSLFVIRPEDVNAFLLPLPVARLPGVVSGERVAKMGVKTVEDLRKLALPVLEQNFGRYGFRLYELSRRLSETDPMIPRVAKKLWSASRKQERIPRMVVLKLKTSEFLTRGHTPSTPPSSCDERTEIALKLRERVMLDSDQRYRLVGVGLSNFREVP